MTSWNELLKQSLTARNETIADIEAITLTASELNINFHFGNKPKIESLMAWSKKYVYFQTMWDGVEWVDAIPRHPVEDALTLHNEHDIAYCFDKE